MKKLVTKISTATLVASFALLFSARAAAVDVMLTDYLSYLEVTHEGAQVRIQRIQDQENMLKDGFAKTSRKCPPFCIQPMKVAAGVKTVGEAEIFRFMDRQLETGKGLIVDARTPSWHAGSNLHGLDTEWRTLAGCFGKTVLEHVFLILDTLYAYLGTIMRDLDIGQVVGQHDIESQCTCIEQQCRRRQ